MKFVTEIIIKFLDVYLRLPMRLGHTLAVPLHRSVFIPRLENFGK